MDVHVQLSNVPRVEGHVRGVDRIIDQEARRIEDDLGQEISRILVDAVMLVTPRGTEEPPRGNPPQRLYTTTVGKVVGKGSNQYQVLRAVEIQQTKTVGRRLWNLSRLLVEGHRIVTRDGREVGFVPGRDYPAEAFRAAETQIEAAQKRAVNELARAITRRAFR